MRISDWSSDVCSSDLQVRWRARRAREQRLDAGAPAEGRDDRRFQGERAARHGRPHRDADPQPQAFGHRVQRGLHQGSRDRGGRPARRSEEHTSELQSLMRISYAGFCLKKKTKTNTIKKVITKPDHVKNHVKKIILDTLGLEHVTASNTKLTAT